MPEPVIANFTVDGWDFHRGVSYVVIDSDEQPALNSARVRLSIPVEVWKRAVFQLISESELRDHGLMFER